MQSQKPTDIITKELAKLRERVYHLEAMKNELDKINIGEFIVVEHEGGDRLSMGFYNGVAQVDYTITIELINFAYMCKTIYSEYVLYNGVDMSDDADKAAFAVHRLLFNSEAPPRREEEGNILHPCVDNKLKIHRGPYCNDVLKRYGFSERDYNLLFLKMVDEDKDIESIKSRIICSKH